MEPKLETPPPEKIRIKIWTSEQKKAIPTFKTPVSTKRLAKRKTLKNSESSLKKPRRK